MQNIFPASEARKILSNFVTIHGEAANVYGALVKTFNEKMTDVLHRGRNALPMEMQHFGHPMSRSAIALFTANLEMSGYKVEVEQETEKSVLVLVIVGAVCDPRLKGEV